MGPTRQATAAKAKAKAGKGKSAAGSKKARTRTDDEEVSFTEGVILHEDGHFITINLLLSHLRQFSGGGTFVAHLNTTYTPPQGHMLSYFGRAYVS